MIRLFPAVVGEAFWLDKKDGRGRTVYFAIGIENPKTVENIGLLWRTAENFGAKFIFVVGGRFKKDPSDVLKTHMRLPFFRYADIDDFYSHIPHGCRLVGVENSEGASDLREFAHFDRTVYLLGAEDNGMTRRALEMCHAVVNIPCENGCFNVSVAGALVMYDRLLKLKRREGK